MMEIKIAINTCYGGFSLSVEAAKELLRRKNIAIDKDFDKIYKHGYYLNCHNIKRYDPDLIAIIEEWGSERVSSPCAKIKVETVYFDPENLIKEYDGKERVW